MAEGSSSSEAFPFIGPENPGISVPEPDLPIPSPEKTSETLPTTDPKVDILQRAQEAESQGNELVGKAYRQLLAAYEKLLEEDNGRFAVASPLGVLFKTDTIEEAIRAIDEESQIYSGNVMRLGGKLVVFGTSGKKEFATREEADAFILARSQSPGETHLTTPYHVVEVLEEKPKSKFDQFLEENPPSPNIVSIKDFPII